MRQMTSIERIRRTLNHQEPDRVPVVFLGLTIGAREVGVNQREYSLNSKALADGQLKYLERYKVDAITPAQGVAFRAEAFGAKIKYYETVKDTAVIQEPAVKKTEDWEKLTINTNSPAMKAYTDSLKIITDKLEDKVAVLGGINSPLTLATQIGTMSQIMKDMKRHPEALHKGLSRIADLYEEFCDCIFAAAKLPMFYFACTRASAEIVTEEQYKEFGVPYDLKVLEYLTKRNVFIMIHVCGNHPFLNLLTQYPVHAINWWDRGTATSLSDAKKRFGDKVTVVGGLDQTRELLSGTPEQVEAQAKDAIRQAAKGGGFILSGGCEISAISPPENIHAAVRAAETYGKYPINL